MSLLSIAQAVADEVGIEQPSAIVGQTTDDTAVRLLALANREGKRLAKSHDWAVLAKEHTFNTADGTATYALPSDFDHFIPRTFWNRTDDDTVLGPLSAKQWQARASGIVVVSENNQAFRIKAETGVKKIHINPTPSAIDALAFDYISKNWVQKDSDSSFTDAWSADADTSILEEELIELGVLWRMLNRLGLQYLEEKNTYLVALEQAKARDGSAATLNMAGAKGFPFPNIPEGGFG